MVKSDFKKSDSGLKLNFDKIFCYSHFGFVGSNCPFIPCWSLSPCNFLLQNTLIFIVSKDLIIKFSDRERTSEFLICSKLAPQTPTNINWFASIWTELSLPLCATVPSHFIVHTSLFSTHLFLPDTVNWNKFIFDECFQKGFFRGVCSRWSSLSVFVSVPSI